MNQNIVRVLLVDDFQPWISSLRSILQELPGMQIIGEASDGLLAVQRACELQPDLILLDIGLPSLNGIEVARRIQDGTPQSKVLFVSENRSRDIAAECLRAGAHGCVVKSEAKRELLSAVRTVLSGRKFISTSLGASDLLSDDNPRLSNAPERIEALAPLPPRNAQIRHEVAFYSDDEALVHAFTRVTKAALHVGNTAIVIAKEAHRIKILQRLKGDRTNLKAFRQREDLASWMPRTCWRRLWSMIIPIAIVVRHCWSISSGAWARLRTANFVASQFAENARLLS